MGSVTEQKQGDTLDNAQMETVESALAAAQSRYIATHAVSKKNHEEACLYMPGGNTRTSLHVSPFPLTVVSGDSCYLTTADGFKYIDFLGEYTAGIYGHSNPVIKQAVQNALQHGWNYGGTSRMEIGLARTICERFPAIQLVRFVNSGTEANMMALATAVAFTRRKKVLIFQGGYHGGTISGSSYPGKASINLPHQFILGRYNDIEGTQALVSALEEDLAAILIEPMMGSAGCYTAKAEFLQYLRGLATKSGAILIFDEVMTSRLTYHGLGHAYGLTPDLMTIGKWVGGGMTFGAFGGRADLMKMYDPQTGSLIHPGTFNNNVFTMAAGVAGCALLAPDVIQRVNALGDSMRRALENIFEKYQVGGVAPEAPVSDEQHQSDRPDRAPKVYVKGVGSLMNVHFGGSHRAILQGLYYHHMLENGIYMAPRGFVALSIEITQTHIETFLGATEKFCQTWHQHLQWLL